MIGVSLGLVADAGGDLQLELDKVANGCRDVGRGVRERTVTTNLHSDVRSLGTESALNHKRRW
jgi:hypothetical protein